MSTERSLSTLAGVGDDTVCASRGRTVLSIQIPTAHRAVSAGRFGGRRRAFARYQKIGKAANIRLD